MATVTKTSSQQQLAINGGRPVRDVQARPFPPWPYFWEDEKQAVQEVLDSGVVNYWRGQKGQEFQARFAAYVGAKYGIAVNSGTSALHVALAAAEVGPGDEVIVPARTFLATAAAVVQQGAVPIFADVEPRTHNLDVESAAALVSERTRAIIPVHLAGHPVEMDAVLDLARRHDLIVIEDGAQAHGAEYRGRKVGSLGHLAAWSFCQDKIFTTGGEGGMVTTNDPELARLSRSVKDHGFEEAERRAKLAGGALDVYTHYRVGYNFRMTEMQSAIGLKALAKIEQHLAQRRANAAYLTAGLQDLCEAGVLLPAYEAPHVRHAYYCYYLTLNLDALTVSRHQFVRAVQAEGVRAAPGSSAEVYREPVFQELVGFGRTRFPFDYHRAPDEVPDYTRVVCPVARDLGQRTVRLEVYPTIEQRDLDDVLAAIHKVADAYRV